MERVAAEPKTKRCIAFNSTELMAFISTMIIGVIAHMMPITKQIVNWDGVGYVLNHSSVSVLSQGKWLFAVILKFFRGPLEMGANTTGAFCAPLSIFWIACMVVLLVRKFNIRRWYLIILLGAIVVTSPSMMSVILYPTEDIFCFAGFLCVLAGCMIISEKKSSICAGTIVLWLGMSIYQAYIGFAVSMLLFRVIIDLCRQEKSLRKIVFEGIRYITCLIIAILMYYVSMKISLLVTGFTLSSYRNIGDAIGAFNISAILGSIPASYQYVVDYILYDKIGTSNPYFYWVFRIMISIGLIGFAALIVKNKTYKRPLNVVFIAILLLLLPFSANVIGALSQNPKSHMLMMFPIEMLFIFPIMLTDMASDRHPDRLEDHGFAISRGNGWKYGLLLGATMLTSFVLLINQIQILSLSYTHNDLTYQTTREYCFNIYEDVCEAEGYQSGMKVALVGTLPTSYDELTLVYSYTGVAKGRILTSERHISRFMQNYMNLDLNFDSSILLRDELFSMPAFPKDGYVRVIDGVAYVKLSEQSTAYSEAIASVGFAVNEPNYAIGGTDMQILKPEATLTLPLTVADEFMENARGKECVLAFEIDMSRLYDLSNTDVKLNLTYVSGGMEVTQTLTASGYDIEKGGIQQMVLKFPLPEDTSELVSMNLSASTADDAIKIGRPMLLITDGFLQYHTAMADREKYGENLLDDKAKSFLIESPADKAYSFNAVYQQFEPATVYTFKMESCTVLQGSPEAISVLLYDRAAKNSYATFTLMPWDGKNEISFTIPSGLDTSNLQLLVYCGERIKTGGNSIAFNGLSLRMNYINEAQLQ